MWEILQLELSPCCYSGKNFTDVAHCRKENSHGGTHPCRWHECGAAYAVSTAAPCRHVVSSSTWENHEEKP